MGFQSSIQNIQSTSSFLNLPNTSHTNRTSTLKKKTRKPGYEREPKTRIKKKGGGGTDRNSDYEFKVVKSCGQLDIVF